MIWRIQAVRQRCAPAAAIGVLCLLAGCEDPAPITYAEFMDDEIARDGTLARCNEDREATAADLECANARRAAAAIALLEERARREVLELESERKLAQLRAEVERERAATREAQQLAEAAARAAYDAQWKDTTAPAVGPDGLLVAPGTAIGPDGQPIAQGTPDGTAIGVDGEPVGTDSQPVVQSVPAVEARESALDGQ
jgi:hypothetical protein